MPLGSANRSRLASGKQDQPGDATAVVRQAARPSLLRDEHGAMRAFETQLEAIQMEWAASPRCSRATSCRLSTSECVGGNPRERGRHGRRRTLDALATRARRRVYARWMTFPVTATLAATRQQLGSVPPSFLSETSKPASRKCVTSRAAGHSEVSRYVPTMISGSRKSRLGINVIPATSAALGSTLASSRPVRGLTDGRVGIELATGRVIDVRPGKLGLFPCDLPQCGRF